MGDDQRNTWKQSPAARAVMWLNQLDKRDLQSASELTYPVILLGFVLITASMAGLPIVFDLVFDGVPPLVLALACLGGFGFVFKVDLLVVSLVPDPAPEAGAIAANGLSVPRRRAPVRGVALLGSLLGGTTTYVVLRVSPIDPGWRLATLAGVGVVAVAIAFELITAALVARRVSAALSQREFLVPPLPSAGHRAQLVWPRLLLTIPLALGLGTGLSLAVNKGSIEDQKDVFAKAKADETWVADNKSAAAALEKAQPRSDEAEASLRVARRDFRKQTNRVKCESGQYSERFYLGVECVAGGPGETRERRELAAVKKDKRSVAKSAKTARTAVASAQTAVSERASVPRPSTLASFDSSVDEGGLKATWAAWAAYQEISKDDSFVEKYIFDFAMLLIDLMPLIFKLLKGWSAADVRRFRRLHLALWREARRVLAENQEGAMRAAARNAHTRAMQSPEVQELITRSQAAQAKLSLEQEARRDTEEVERLQHELLRAQASRNEQALQDRHAASEAADQREQEVRDRMLVADLAARRRQHQSDQVDHHLAVQRAQWAAVPPQPTPPDPEPVPGPAPEPSPGPGPSGTKPWPPAPAPAPAPGPFEDVPPNHAWYADGPNY